MSQARTSTQQLSPNTPKRKAANRPVIEAYAAIVAFQHHGQLGGSGYLGLRNAEIRPHAKLIAVADVFDALISPRPYHNPWSIRRTCFYLADLAGVQFDESVV